MSKIKKILAVLVAMVMVIAMVVPAFAEGIPQSTDTAFASVYNVESNATVKAYQITKGKYNSNGFVEYVKANDSLKISNVLAPTSDEVAQIANMIDKETLNLTSVTLNSANITVGEETVAAYGENLQVGYWVVIIRGTVNVYNPVLLGVYYSVSGSNNTMIGGCVDASTDWSLEGTDAYAKSSTPSLTKDADKETQNLGGIVNYTITTKVPDYSAEYDTATFEIHDDLTNLYLKTNTVKVYSAYTEEAQTEIGSDNYTITEKGDEEGNKVGFVVKFTPKWILANGRQDVIVKYSATLERNAMNEVSGDNAAYVKYTNKPGDTHESEKDIEKVYTFDIDGNVTGDILKKVKRGTTEGKTEALSGAIFTLYNDQKCTNKYTNKYFDGTTTSDSEGKLKIEGLAAGTYYLKETIAPKGYTINNTVYRIEVSANLEGEELKEWNIEIKPMVEDGTTADNKFSVDGGSAKPDEKNQTTEIMNTTISELPSTGGIGTTIFTVGGCLIMIAAAALFFINCRKASK